MGFAIALAVIYIVVVYLVFVKFKWLKFSIVWGIISFWIGFHVLLVFVIGMRFYAPYTIDAHIVRNTIQIVPRLEGPTLLTEVLVEPNVPVKKGQPLYKFDTTFYDQNLKSARAQLAAAEQNISIMQADSDAAASQLAEAEAQLSYSLQQQKRFSALSTEGGARQEDVDKWNADVEANTAAVAAATANLRKAQLALNMNVDGVNTSFRRASQSAFNTRKSGLQRTPDWPARSTRSPISIRPSTTGKSGSMPAGNWISGARSGAASRRQVQTSAPRSPTTTMCS